jgi:hypothetical protein
MPTYQIKTDNHSETVAAMTIILAAAVFRAKYRVKEQIKSIKIMDKLRKTLMLYCIEKNISLSKISNISLSKISQGMVDNPFPIGSTNIYRFYLDKHELSQRQRTKLKLFFELENYDK